MKSLKISSVLLFLGVLLLAVFIGGKQINKSIQETIELNYQSEIEALKEKLSKQSELINSIIGINDKNNGNSANTQNNPIVTTSTTASSNNSPTSSNKIEDEFEYKNENGGITITCESTLLLKVHIFCTDLDIGTLCSFHSRNNVNSRYTEYYIHILISNKRL